MAAETSCMARAVSLARQGQGFTAPNPCVGAVLVLDGDVVAEGWHTRCGQPHAEIEALRDARSKGINPRHCVLYVTLEPCNHHGKTPPCTQAIVDAGIPEVVIGCPDPNPVAAGGMHFLRSRGIVVQSGVLEKQCQDLIADFRIWQTTGRPYSILKLATTLDGRIATRTGHSAWISGQASRREVHRLRSWCGAVIVGGATFRADNPMLTCRLDGHAGPQPLAVVVSSRLPENPHDFDLLRLRPEQTIFWTTLAESLSPRGQRLADLGVMVWALPAGDFGLDLTAGMIRLRQDKNCYYTLTEGGGRLAASLRQQGLVDELRLFQAMKVLGDEHGQALFAGRNVASMEDCWTFELMEQSLFDSDLYLRLRPKE